VATKNQSKTQLPTSKNLVACPFPVGRSADPASIELSSRLFGAGPINYEPRTTDNKQRLPAVKNQSNAQGGKSKNPFFQNFFNCLYCNNLIPSILSKTPQISHQMRNPL